MSRSTIVMYHNPRCSKSRATLELLQEQGVEPEIVEYMKEPPDKETLAHLVELLGVSPRELLRTNEQVYKDAGLDESDLSDEDILEALAQCPTILQRPIVTVDDDRAAIGRPPEKVLEIL